MINIKSCINVLLGLILMVCCVNALAQKSKCYTSNREKAIELFQKNNYSNARELFSKARLCKDCPKNHDIYEWVKKCVKEENTIKANGNWRLHFDFISEFTNSIAYVSLKSMYGIVDTSGKIIVPLIYNNIYPFNEGFAVVQLGDNYGFIDNFGNLKIPIKYNSVGNFHNGLAAVSQEGKYGFIDTSGKVVIPIKYNSVSPFVGDYTLVNKGFSSFFVDKNGKEKNNLDYLIQGENIKGHYIVSQQKNFGLIDSTLKITIPIDFKNITFLTNDIYLAKKANKLFIYHKSGKLLFKKPIIKAVSKDFSYVAFFYKNKVGLFDSTGKVVFKPKHKGIEVVNRNLFVIKDGANVFLTSSNNKKITTLNYSEIRSFDNNLAIVKRDNKYGFIDTLGVEVIKAEWNNVFPFKDGFARVKKQNKMSFIDLNGKVISKKLYEDAGDFSYGLAKVKINGMWGFINAKGELVIPPNYYGVSDFIKDKAEVIVEKTETTITKRVINNKNDFMSGSEYDDYCVSTKIGVQQFIINSMESTPLYDTVFEIGQHYLSYNELLFFPLHQLYSMCDSLRVKELINYGFIREHNRTRMFYNEYVKKNDVDESLISPFCNNLQEDICLSEIALIHSRDMCENKFFAHESSDGTPFYLRVSKHCASIDGTVCGENCISGFNDIHSGIKGWHLSNGHFFNMINVSYYHIGFGYWEERATTDFRGGTFKNKKF